MSILWIYLVAIIGIMSGAAVFILIEVQRSNRRADKFIYSLSKAFRVIGDTAWHKEI